LHDLRDTAAHAMRKELRVRGPVIEDILCHTPTRLERTYQGERRSSLAEMAETLVEWSATLDTRSGSPVTPAVSGAVRDSLV